MISLVFDPTSCCAATIDGFVSDCREGCTFQQLFIAGSSSSVTDAAGRITIRSIAANGDEPGDWRLDDPDAWRPARPYGESDTPPVSLEAGPAGVISCSIQPSGV